MSATPGSRSSPADKTVVLSGNFIAEGRTVPVENGWAWIANAWSIFRRAIGIWIGMAVTLLIVFIVLAVVPLGAIVSFLVTPVFGAGLVIASRTIDEGGQVQFSQLFAGFAHRFGTLLVVGLLYLIGTAVITIAVVVATGISIFELMNATSPEHAIALGLRFVLAMLLILALMLPLVMAIWFAPPLVVFQGLGAVEAMKASFTGCLRNMLPFLLYGVVLLIFGVIASIPMGLGWLLLLPVMAASIYTAYRDIYFAA
jgi:uncharacterized membrane protein